MKDGRLQIDEMGARWLSGTMCELYLHLAWQSNTKYSIFVVLDGAGVDTTVSSISSLCVF